MSIINNANENYFRHCSQNSLSNSFLYLKHMVENIFSLELSILSAFFDIAFCIQIFIFLGALMFILYFFFQNILQTISPKNFFFLIWYILAKIQIKRWKKSAKGKGFLFLYIQSNNYQSGCVRKAYNCHQKKNTTSIYLC